MHSSASNAEVRKRWIDAVTMLNLDMHAVVQCPVCGEDTLTTRDVAWQDGQHLDRYLSCPKCGANNVLTKLVEPSDAK